MAAATIIRYNHTLKLFANQEVNLANIKVMLRNGTTFTASQTVVSQLDGTEESGNGWTAGGEDLSVVVEEFDTNKARVNATTVTVVASGGTISASDAVIIDSTPADPLVLWHFDFPEVIDAQDGVPFVFEVPPTGIQEIGVV